MGRIPALVGRRITVLLVVAVTVASVVFHLPWPAGFDAMSDWVFTRSAWAGVDPFTSWETQAAYHGTTPIDYGAASKTPAVAVATGFWLVLPFDWVPAVSIALDVAGLACVVWLTMKIAGPAPWWMLAFLLPFIQGTVRLGNPIVLWVLLAFLTWYGSEGRDAGWVGVPLGVAAAVRIWPGLLAVALWAQGKRRTAVGVGATAAALNVAGLASPGITWTGAVGGLLGAREAWSGVFHDVSLVRLLGGSTAVVVLVCVAAVIVTYRTRSVYVASVAAVLMSPVAWTAYYLAAAPAVVKAARRTEWLLPAVLVVVFRPAWWAVPVAGLGLLAFTLPERDPIRTPELSLVSP